MPVGFRIRVRREGNKTSLKTLGDNLISIHKYTGIELHQLGYAVVDKMIEYIDPRKRPKNYVGSSNLGKALRKTVKIEERPDSYRVIVGDTNYLNKVAPYWYILNYGGSPWKKSSGKGQPFPSYGTFGDGKPRRGASGSAWYPGGTGDTGTMFFMRPKHPIEGKRYINKAINWLNREWSTLSRRLPGIGVGIRAERFARTRLGMKEV